VLFYVFLCCVVLCIVCVYICTELLPPGGYPIAVKFIILYKFNSFVQKQSVVAEIIIHINLCEESSLPVNVMTNPLHAGRVVKLQVK
jgi:1,4-dihydroxy-2-naphthoate octaprenyltransferase